MDVELIKGDFFFLGEPDLSRGHSGEAAAAGAPCWVEKVGCLLCEGHLLGPRGTSKRGTAG